MLMGQVIFQNEPTAERAGRPRMSTVMVVHFWSDEHGYCRECGNPAAFLVPDAYGDVPIGDEHKRCAVCAANAAADGELVTRIVPEDED